MSDTTNLSEWLRELHADLLGRQGYRMRDICEALQQAAAALAEREALQAERDEIVSLIDEMMGIPDEPKTLVQRVRDELADYQMVIEHAAHVFDHVTRGRISKPNTLPREVCAVADDLQSAEIDEAVQEAEARADQAEARVSALQRELEEMDAEAIAGVVAHWFLQGGEAEFGPIREAKNADDVVAAILRVVRASRRLSADMAAEAASLRETIESLRLEVELADEGRREEVARLREQLAAVQTGGRDRPPVNDPC